MTEDLVGQLLVAVRPLTNGEVASFALLAFTADYREGHHDPVALLQLSIDAGTDLDDLAHHLVAHDVAGQHRRNEIVEEVQVRTADRPARHLDDRIPGILDLGIGDGITPNIFFAVPNESLHANLRASPFRGAQLQPERMVAQGPEESCTESFRFN